MSKRRRTEMDALRQVDLLLAAMAPSGDRVVRTAVWVPEARRGERR
ncbi:hypothetical protein SAMN05216553_108318 [Lentzea fradiae]|uniref:Uncharacterized protein n=1 Tax=Lentzea fradiae TaxID=200378 RepID=A0A1G7UNH4_9PSEU|nr:hypothetical protein [Lentzea fradiae]SDG49112.1 hypothetical protein SAMN05216553_108318 [Lentzea fradiae]